MPSNSAKVKVRAVESYGAQIVFCEPTQEAREAACAEVIAKTGAILIHSFENEYVMAGQGTAAVELLQDIPDIDVVICPVGGGGLLCGTAAAAKSIRPEIKVIAAEPLNPIGWLTLTSVLYVQGRSSEAAEAVETAHRLEAETGIDIESFISLAVVRSDAGRFDEARKIFEANLAEKPSSSAHIAYAFDLLRLGLFRDGWQHYEFRLMQPNRLSDRLRYGKPPWTGQSLQGRTVLLRREQGFGDVIQFVRYAPMLKALGATVWLQVGAAMNGLAKRFDGVDRVFTDGDALPDFDFYVHLPSLPRLFGTELQTIPSNVPYLRPSDEHLAKWKKRLGETSTFKVGLVWAGHPNHLRDWERSIPLKALMPLAGVEGVRLFSLQKGDASAELASVSDLAVEDLSPDLSDFSDTAAAIQCLDLIISVDTAVAHLAGALARPVWLLLPKVGDFRWLESRTDSSWYPTMRLFRQERRGEWGDVVVRVSEALKTVAEGPGELMQRPHQSPMA